MSKFESITTCDYINFVEATEKGKELMRDKKTELIGFYIIVAINTGLRVGDIKRITFEDLRMGTLKIKEQKTNKHKELPFNPQIKTAFNNLRNNELEGLVFKTQKNCVISTQHLNVLLKEVFAHLLPTHCVSSHSLRKTFGRRVYENNKRSEEALIYLGELFNHSTLTITKKYLGIRKEELNNIYMNL